MYAIEFAGSSCFININVMMNESEYSNFSNTILKINQVRDLSFSKIADWIRINLPTARDFLEWYGNTDTRRWYYPENKIIIDTLPGISYLRVIIRGLATKPKINFNNIAYEYDGKIVNSEVERYCRDDVLTITDLMRVSIKNVIFNNPATIVFWSDGTKTVCTCSEADTYDPEKGLALCCMKKLLYKNKGHIFNNAREKWLKKAKK